MENNNHKSDEDFLRDHINQSTSSSINNGDSKVHTNTNIESSNRTVGDLNYLVFAAEGFPCGSFYPHGTTFNIRAAEVKEIQAYSMIDDSNAHDIIVKMNDMLSHCVRVKYPNGEMGSYLDIRDPDRFYLIFTIRELTFQKGNNLVSKGICNCGITNEIELLRSNFTFHEIDSSLTEYFNQLEGYYMFELNNGEVYKIAPPKIGLQKSFTEYIIAKSVAKESINLSFLKIIPYILYDRKSITIEGIDKKLIEFNNMKGDTFQFLNEVVGMLNYGIKGLKKECSCGMEVHSDMIFPNGASGVFVISNAFSKYIKK